MTPEEFDITTRFPPAFPPSPGPSHFPYPDATDPGVLSEINSTKKSRARYWILAIKSTKLLKLAKALKLLKFGKVFITFLSMLLSVIVYAFLLGPWFSIGFVAMLFIHEMGHIAALRMRGYETPGPVFIPMIGAVVFAPKFRDSGEEASVGLAGPLVGGIAALGAFALWFALGRRSEILLLVSYTAAFLNLFNLIPIRPLDGGRVMQVAGRGFQYVGLASLFGLSFYIRQPYILFIWIIILQDIRLHPKFKALSSAALWVSMAALMSMGFSDQPWLVDVFDVLFAGMCMAMYFSDFFEGKDSFADYHAYKTPIPVAARYKWVALYLLVGIGLVWLMFAEGPHLPRKATHKPPKGSISQVRMYNDSVRNPCPKARL